MRRQLVFVYEHITAGGCGRQPPASLLAEGSAMRRALLDGLLRSRRYDVATIDGIDGLTPSPDASVRWASDAASRREQTARLAEEADGVVVIAPETQGDLLQTVEVVTAAGGQLWSPAAEFVSVCGDKGATDQLLRAAQIPTPGGVSVRRIGPHSIDYPAVLKPLDGAGSQGILLLETPPERVRELAHSQWLEPLVEGLAASVGVLNGPEQTWALPPCTQRLGPQFEYRGGEIITCPVLIQRAQELALRALGALPPTRGFVGVDLVLGATAAEDAIIEVNPRLTTSFVGLSALARDNLAAAMIDAAQGVRPALSFDSEALEFDPHGNCRPAKTLGPSSLLK